MFFVCSLRLKCFEVHRHYWWHDKPRTFCRDCRLSRYRPAVSERSSWSRSLPEEFPQFIGGLFQGSPGLLLERSLLPWCYLWKWPLSQQSQCICSRFIDQFSLLQPWIYFDFFTNFWGRGGPGPRPFQLQRGIWWLSQLIGVQWIGEGIWRFCGWLSGVKRILLLLAGFQSGSRTFLDRGLVRGISAEPIGWTPFLLTPPLLICFWSYSSPFGRADLLEVLFPEGISHHQKAIHFESTGQEGPNTAWLS